MKDQEITSTELDTRIRKNILKLLKSDEGINSHQKGCLDSDLAEKSKLPIGLKLPSRRFKRLLGYLALYHFYPTEPSILCYFHLDLLEHLSKSESYWLSVLLEDKELYLKWLVEQRTITSQQFFAGICSVQELRSLRDEIEYIFEEKLKRPRRIVRRKGYRDKGSLADPDTRILRQELREDFYLTLYQYELEEKQLIQSENAILLRSFLAEGRVLTDELKVEFRLLPRKGVNNEQREGKTSAAYYCKQRSHEEDLRKERKARRAAEELRIQNLLSGTGSEES